MAAHVVVLGAGYAGARAITVLEALLDGSDNLTWISDRDHHLVLHESHRCIRDPDVSEKITVPVETIKSRATRFFEDEVVAVDATERVVRLEDRTPISYDYLLVALGSRTAFYGIPGLEEHAHTLKSLDDALGIHEAIATAAESGEPEDPARVVVGGAGLSGIQVAGEVAAYRDEQGVPIDVVLVEGLDSVLPNGAPELQAAIRKRLERADVTVETGQFVGEVADDVVHLGENRELAYDVFVWTGGIAGGDAVRESDLRTDERSHRIDAERNFQTSDERVFAIGDCALVDQPGDEQAPPTAQAAWQAAEVAADNVDRALREKSLRTWTYEDMGTVVSIGDDAVAHDVSYHGIGFPMTTFGGFPARTLKKSIAAKWLRKIDGTGRAVSAWSDL